MTVPSAKTVMDALLTPMLTVSVVIATIGRPEMLRDALRAIIAQDYAGPIEIVVVFDGIDIDTLDDVNIPPNRCLVLARNSRTGGLAGGRNTGILASSGSIIGFCDDDDIWYPQKLRAQLELWSNDPSAVAVSAGIVIKSATGNTDRCPPTRATFRDFLASRMTAIHPSTILFRRQDFLGRVGLVDEELPGSYGEDYELLLRATRYGDVISVPIPLVTVRWDRPSFFAGKWHDMAIGLSYILQKVPELESCPKGLSRIAAQVAFSYAALGDRRTALRWAQAAIRRDPRQLRTYGALAVVAGLPADGLLRMVNRRGRGL